MELKSESFKSHVMKCKLVSVTWISKITGSQEEKLLKEKSDFTYIKCLTS